MTYMVRRKASTKSRLKVCAKDERGQKIEGKKESQASDKVLITKLAQSPTTVNYFVEEVFQQLTIGSGEKKRGQVLLISF